MHFVYNIFFTVALHELLDKGDFLLERECSVEPMERNALSFHASEPSHLSFGEAADVGVEVAIHLVVGALAAEVLGDMAVF